MSSGRSVPAKFAFSTCQVGGRQLLRRCQSPFDQLFRAFLRFLIHRLQGGNFSVEDGVQLLTKRGEDRRIIRLFAERSLSQASDDHFYREGYRQIASLLVCFTANVSRAVRRVPGRECQVGVLRANEGSVSDMTIVSRIHRVGASGARVFRRNQRSHDFTDNGLSGLERGSLLKDASLLPSIYGMLIRRSASVNAILVSRDRA